MIFLPAPPKRIFTIVLIGAALTAAGAVAAESPDAGLRIDRLGQGIKDIGRRLDVTQLFNRRAPEPDDDLLEPARDRDAAAASVRIDRLESQIRTLNGQIEQLQHDIRRLEEQLRNAHASTGAAPVAPAARSAAAPEAAPIGAPTTTTAGASPSALRRGDAFDPSRDPSAAGAPRPLGSTPPSAPLAAGTPAQPHPATAAGSQPPSAASDLRSPGAPLDLTHGRLNEAAPSVAAAPTAAAPAAAPPAASPPPQTAALGPTPTAPQTPKDEYDVALAHLRQGEYEAAEKAFAGFLAKNPKSKLASQATFNLGESFFLRQRHSEAAQKYLEISTKFPTSAQAPEALLRLGQSLHAIGAKEQACASFNEISAKYPGAPARVREAAQRESKKVQC